MKIIELADLHLDPKWIEQQKPCLDVILKTGIKEKPDFICIAGDIYNRPFYNSDKDSISFVLKFIEDLQKIASVIMITGTPSHDAPGSYAVFEKMGCTVLNSTKHKVINNCLFIGLPEIDKIAFISQNKIKDMDTTNTKINFLLEKYITLYWAPIRENNKHIPCVFLGHGVFIDNIHDNNPIIKNSDIIIDNNKLVKIKADRYIFGHFHTPEESKILNGGYVGYMGFDRTPWNNTGFQPGFNVTKIKIINEIFDEKKIDYTKRTFETETKRIYYPVVRKDKIKISVYNLKHMEPHTGIFKDCDLRINLKIKKSELLKLDLKKYEKLYKAKLTLNSCEIIPDIIKEESQRITHEHAEKLQTLWDKYVFFKGWKDCSVTGKHKSYYKKIYEIEKNVSLKSQSLEEKTIKLLYLEIYNSIFSIDAQGKNTFFHDFSNDPTGLTLISGDNGQGKSTFFGFASPYPIFIGWDYRSLKEFFPDGGHIRKIFDVNGIKHEHIISVTQKKIECFWNIEKEIIEFEGTPDRKGKQNQKKIWKPFLQASQLKDFMSECEKFFGPVSSFISTSFFAQEPWRMKNYISSLVSSSQTELRNAYMEIVGISREAEKLYAREKKEALKKEIEKLEIQKSTMSNILADKNTVVYEYDKLETELNKLYSELLLLNHDEYEKQKEFNKVEKEYNEQLDIINKIDFKNDAILDIEKRKVEITNKISELKKIKIEELKKQIVDNHEKTNKLDFLRDQWQDINKKKSEILEDIKCNESAIIDLAKKIDEANNAIKIYNNQIESYKKENILLNIPCPKCGYIKPENKQEIIYNNNRTIECKKNIEVLEKEIKQYIELKQEYQDYINKQKLPNKILKQIEIQADKLKSELLNQDKIQIIQNQITEYSQIKIYEENLNKILSDIMLLKCDINDLMGKQNLFIQSAYEELKEELEKLQNQIKEKQIEQSSKEGMLKEIKKQLEQIIKYENEITEILKKLDILVIDFSEWETIESDMQANKLPAFELDIIAGEIDFLVNQKLNGRYIIKTNTQDINKKGDIIDRFEILVYNPQSGIEKSLLAHSPGQRAAYFIEPISQALREKRQDREKIIFTWSIADETDNPIKFERVREYYEIMQAGLPQDHTRFIMSQKSEIYQFIKNTINIEDIGENA